MDTNNNKIPGGKKNNMPKFSLSWLYIAVIAALAFMLFQGNDSSGGANKEVDYTSFKTYVANNYGTEVVIDKTAGEVSMTIRPEHIREVFKAGTDRVGKQPTVSAKYGSIDRLDDYLAENFKGKVKYRESDSFFLRLLSSFLPIILLVFLWFFMMRRMGGGAGGGVFSVGKSKAKLFDKNGQGTNVTFKDVAGQEGAKQEVREIVDFLKNPKKYTELGGKIPKGALLVGPPGTGKTLLAKAVAGEADVPFFSMSGSDFVEMFVGVGASRVRDLFSQAKEKSPCIIFIDEIDAIGRARGKNPALGGNDERENTLNQLLTEMDGFEGNNGVIILAATNRPESLDAALTRPGRFDRRVPVELPDLKGREDILKVHAKKIRIADDIDFNKIARMAAGASGAELANIVNEAALRAVRDGRSFANESDMEESIEVVIAGYQKKNAILSDKEKLVVSYHEIGHALVAALQDGTAPVQKITIIPRTSGALGYAMQVDKGNHYLVSKEELMSEIATLCGGRAAEEVEFRSVSTGASNDIEKATKLARQMITQYGMSSEFGMVALETVNNQYLGGDSSLACSPDTQTKIDQQVVSLVEQQHQKAIRILTENKHKMDELAQNLYEKETITGDEFMDILNRKPQLEDKTAEAAAEKTEREE